LLTMAAVFLAFAVVANTLASDTFTAE